MRHGAIVVLTLVAALAGPAAEACGDKFLLVGKGALFPQGYRAAHPASVLIYLPNVRQKNAGSDIVSVLRRAGHTAIVVTTERALADAMTAGRVDIVVGGAEAISGIDRSRSARARPVVLLPVLPQPTDEELASARKRHGFVVNGQEPVNRFLHTIDDAMESSLNMDLASR